MAYVLNYSGGTITVPIGQANTTNTSLTLVGRNWTSSNIDQGYGQALNQNFVSMLENFAAATSPTSPLKGQLWYDTTTPTEIKINTGTPITPVWLSLYSTGSSINQIGNGTSNVFIPVAGGNINMSVGGSSNVLVVTSTGANVFGTLTSNTSVSGPVLISTINDGVTAPLSVASNIKVTDLNADLLDGFHADTTPNSLNTIVVRNATTGAIDNNINGNIIGAVGNLTTINTTTLNAVTVAGSLTTAAQPNITSLGTLTGLTSTGNINFTGAPNVSLGQVGNVRILGGGPGSFLVTNGSGDLSWSTTASPITASTVTTPTLTTGAIGNSGTITGNWTLTPGSRFQATYADLAEYYVIDRSAGAGTVVEFGGSAEIKVCDVDMSRRVAGVVSTNPAFVMNAENHKPGEIMEAVALQGRVPCKVIGTTVKGDLMVSAGNGCARAESDPVTGSVIGKALENKNTTEMGVIEVAVGRL